MRWSRLIFHFVVVLSVTAISVPVWAAEFSPNLDNELLNAADGANVSAIVILKSPIDMRALDSQLHVQNATKAERHRQVLAALHYNADMTQPAFLAELDEAKASGQLVGYNAFWIDNLIIIQATKEFVETLRPRGDIDYVTENFRPELIEPIRSEQEGGNPLASLTVPPGIRAVGAYRVNTELGITGQGVIVSELDTGVDGNHPALAARWRGNFAPWWQCWKDALSTTPTQFPSDGNGHGTHTMGTITGRAIVGSDTQWVGCAPNARWIEDNCINQGVSSEFDNDVIRGFQWLTDPDTVTHDPAAVPDVCQNSWGVFTGLGYAQCFNFWNNVILNCEAGGTVVTWSAGNEGTSGLRSPAIYSINAYQMFSVGAVDASAYPNFPYPIASFSSRGPTPCTPFAPDNIKPEISAPGVNVYSSVPGGGYDGTYSGTSMAGPHIAGIIALMREACPNCDYITIKQTLMSTALDEGTVGQDNTYGWGFVDGYNAVLSVMGNRGRVTGVIRDSNTLTPLQASVQVVGGNQNTTSDASGIYWLNLPADSIYTIRYSLYGYTTQDISVTVLTNDTTTQNVNLVARPVITVLCENFESGAPGWTHSGAGGSWVDDWNPSTERAHGGTGSYKCGDTGTGNYRNLNDARLYSPVINSLPDSSRLSFWYQINSEVSGLYQDSCYDGGMLELSVNSGPYAEVFPTVNGYNKHFRYRTSGNRPYNGPVPGAPCWAETLAVWRNVQLDLSPYANQNIQLRWRFGSDSSGTREGWYVDDVCVTAFATGTVSVPIAVTIYVSGADLILRWNPDGNPAYKIYSDTVPDGAFGTLEGTSITNSFTVPGGAADPKKFYQVHGWDGN